MKEKCPSCGFAEPIEGCFIAQIGERGVRHVFRPDGLKFLRLSGDIPVPNGERFTACPQCGLLWSSLDASQLRGVMKKHGNPDTKDESKDKD